MHSQVESSNRRLVVIVDPHIKVSNDYYVYTDGMTL